jgi:hypothetical protein
VAGVVRRQAGEIVVLRTNTATLTWVVIEHTIDGATVYTDEWTGTSGSLRSTARTRP